jgi:hypothetical protein
MKIPEALQQAARHRIIQVQMAAGRALKAWKGELVEEPSKNRGLSVWYKLNIVLRVEKEE